MSPKERALRETLVDLPAPACIFDATARRFIAANNLYCAIVGYTEEELKQLPWPKILPDDFVEPAERALASNATAQDAPVIWEWRQKNGNTVAAACRYRPMTLVLDDERVTTAFFVVVVGMGESPIPAMSVY